MMIIVSGYTEPMTEISAGRLELLNEVFVLFITYHLYQFTDFMPDLAVRDVVGKSIIYTTFANVAINIGHLTQTQALLSVVETKKGNRQAEQKKAQ